MSIGAGGRVSPRPTQAVWSPSAFQQLESAYQQMADKASFVAGPFVERWLGMVDEVLLYPDIGRKCPGFDPLEVRERIFGGYRMIYEVAESSIRILAILEVSRHPGTANRSP